MIPGSPPHGRGTPDGGEGGVRHRGLTPARAGNTGPWPTARAAGRAHPRTGGEHSYTVSRNERPLGSPPHGRGTPRCEGHCRMERRLTPARAGNTATTPTDSASRWAHPRTGGEHVTSTNEVTSPSGSPPHGRGTPGAPLHQSLDDRLTPARAGNTRVVVSHDRLLPAHPRTGGEHGGLSWADGWKAGSPPHGRGTPRHHHTALGSAGLTPARAGNTPRTATAAPCRSAHPRTGGEHGRAVQFGIVHVGSPPHGRGTLDGGGGAGQLAGLTPARAGNTSSSAAGSPGRWAHPRTGGEHPPRTGGLGGHSRNWRHYWIVKMRCW